MLPRALLLAVLIPSPSLAAEVAPLPIELTWNAPPRCGDASTVLADVRAMLKGTAPLSDRPMIEVDVTLQRTNTGELLVQLSAVAGGAAGGRSLVVADCAEATHATALLLALMASPQAGSTDTANAPGDHGPEASPQLPLSNSQSREPALTHPLIFPSASVAQT